MSLGLLGCGYQDAASTPADIASFKGGPMPASAAETMAEKMRQAGQPGTVPAANTH